MRACLTIKEKVMMLILRNAIHLVYQICYIDKILYETPCQCNYSNVFLKGLKLF